MKRALPRYGAGLNYYASTITRKKVLTAEAMRTLLFYSDKYFDSSITQEEFDEQMEKFFNYRGNLYTGGICIMFATNSLQVGFDVKTLSEILGHASVETTLNRYVHTSIERKIECMSLLEAPSFEVYSPSESSSTADVKSPVLCE